MKLLSLLSLVVSVATAVEQIGFKSNGTQLVGYLGRLPAKSLEAECLAKRDLHQSLSWLMAWRRCKARSCNHMQNGSQKKAIMPSRYRVRCIDDFIADCRQFDYRHWGESDGMPRNIVDLDRQQDDYRAAVKAVKKLKGVDASKILIWGSSLSGGTVLNLGPSFYNNSQSGVVGVISQVPHTNGPATASLPPQDTIPNLVQLSLADRAANRTDNPIYIPVANYTGQLGLLTQACALDGYLSIQPNPPGPEFSNIAARFILALPTFSPDAIAAQSHLPTYIGIGLNDDVVSPDAAVKLSERMPNATTYKYEGVGHFDVYPGASAYRENLDNQVAFLKKNFPIRHR